MRRVFQILFLTITPLVSTCIAFSQSNYDTAVQTAAGEQFAEATDILMTMLAAGKSDAKVCARIAEYSLYADRLGSIRKQLEKELKRRAEDPAPALALAFQEKLQENWSACYSRAQEALHRGATQPELIVLLVESAVYAKKTDKLPSKLSSLRESDAPEMYDFGYAVWRSLIRNNKSALKTTATYLSSKPNSPAGLVLQAELLAGNNEWELASQARHKAMANTAPNEPGYPEILLAIAEDHFELANADSGEYYLTLANRVANSCGALITQAKIIDRLIPILREEGSLRYLTRLCEWRVRISSYLKRLEDQPSSWLTLARTYFEMENYSKSVEYDKFVLSSKHASAEQKAEAAILSGRIFRKQQDFVHAETYFEQAADLAKDSKDSRSEHLALYELADVYGQTNRREAAKRLLERVRFYGQRTQQHDFTEAAFVAFAQLNLREPANYHDANYFMRMADGLARQTSQLNLSANHRWLQGNMWLAQNEIEDAETYFMRSVELGKETGVYLAVIAGQAGLLRTYLRAGFNDLALEQAETVLISLRQYYVYCRNDREIRYFDLKSDLFFPVVEAFANNGKLTRMFDACELYDAFVQHEQLEGLRYQLGTDLVDSLSTQLLQLERGIKSRWQELWSFWRRSNRDNLEMVTEIKDSIDSLHNKRTRVLATLDTQYPEFSFIFHPTTTPIIELRDNLHKNGCFYLKYLCGKNATYAILVSDETILCKRLEIGGDSIARLVELISPSFIDHNVATENHVFDLGAAGVLYDSIFAPIQNWLAKNSTLIINPDTPFGALPFEMLVKNGTDLSGSQDYAHARYLMEDHPISYANRGSAAINSRKRNRKSQGLLLAVSPGMDEIKANGHSKTTARDTSFIYRLRELAPGNSNETLTAGSATLREFRAETRRFRLLHAVLPVNFDRVNPLYSSLAFSDSTRLMFSDLFRTTLNSEFILLETRDENSKQTPGRTTIACLTDAFRSAGVNGFATNLWSNEGPEMRRIMTGFYRNLRRGMDSVRALQRAKVDFMARNKNPYYWAGLVSIGPPASIDFNGHNNYLLILITILGVVTLGYFIFRQYRSIRETRSSA